MQANKQDKFDRDRRDPSGSHGGAGGRPAHQVDDNQDDLGRDVNNPDHVANEINKHAEREPGKGEQSSR